MKYRVIWLNTFCAAFCFTLIFGVRDSHASDENCLRYAKSATVQSQMTRQLQCNLEGEVSKLDQTHHLKVCKSNGEQSLKSEQDRREAGLLSCSQKFSVSGSFQINGVWSTKNKSEDGIGSQWIFASDSRYIFVFGSIAEFSYSIADDRIIMRRTDIDGELSISSDLRQSFRVEGQKLYLTPENSDARQEFVRIDARGGGDQDIVGDWGTIHDSGAPAILRISQDQKIQWTVPFRLSSGRFEIDTQSGSIRLFENDKSEPQIVQYRIQDDELLLTDSHDAKTEFQLFR